MKKRVLSALLAIVMVLSFVPAAFAIEPQPDRPVAKNTITITPLDQSKEYDGTTTVDNTKYSFTVTKPDGTGAALKAAEKLNVTLETSVLYPGSGTVKVKSYKVTNGGADKTADYIIVATATATMTVTNRSIPLTITVQDQDRLYDGTASINSTLYGISGDLASGDNCTVTLVNKDSVVDAGFYTDGLTANYQIMHNGEKDVTSYYANVTVNKGDLAISKRGITLTSGSATKAYDGTPLTKSDVQITAGDGFIGTQGFNATTTGSQTNVGTSKNTFTYELTNGAKAGNYDITENTGDLTVTPAAALTITAKSASKMYDGTPLTKNDYGYTGKLCTGDKLEVTVTGEITHFGTAANKVTSYKIKNAAGNDVTSNYAQAELIDGTLSITKRDVVMTSGDASKKYDGTPLTNSNVTVTGSGFVTGEGADYNVTGTQTTKGSSQNIFDYTLKSGTSAADYSISKAYGTLTVEKADAITITAKNATKEYDGTELTCGGYTVTGTLGTGDYVTDVTMKDESKITNVGNKANKIKGYKILNALGQDVTDSYKAADFVDGTLTVTKAKITLTSASKAKIYDGTALTENKVEVTSGAWAKGDGAEYTCIGSRTLAGTSKNTFSYKLNPGTKKENYEITTVEGDLTIRPIEQKITIKVDDQTKEFDRTTKIDTKKWHVEAKSGLLKDDVLTAVIRTDDGYVPTGRIYVASYTIKNAKGEDVTACYSNVVVKEGVLTIKNIPDTITVYNVKVNAENGKVLPSYNSVVAGETVTLDIYPNEGYLFDSITVTDASGKVTLTTVKSGEQYSFKMPASDVTVKATFIKENNWTNPFEDVAETDKFFDAVLWAANNGVTSGVDATHFNPTGIVTRAQMVTFLWRAAGSPKATSAENPFTDVKANAYYYDAVLWAVEEGITEGVGNNQFAPNKTITRAQAITFMYRFAGEPTVISKVAPYKDASVNAYFYDALVWAKNEGIVTSEFFVPYSGASRADAVEFLYDTVVK